MALKLAVVIGSVRPGRVGPSVAAWFLEAAREHGNFDVTLVDLADVGLPLLDEPEHPVKQLYEHEHTKKWAAIVDDADAFVFVTPEYDFFAPASLLNAIQYLSKEWGYKPAGIVSYGGISGGLRSTQMVRLQAIEPQRSHLAAIGVHSVCRETHNRWPLHARAVCGVRGPDDAYRAPQVGGGATAAAPKALATTLARWPQGSVPRRVIERVVRRWRHQKRELRAQFFATAPLWRS